MKDCKFNISLDKIIFGWNIENVKYTFANILIELASYSVYKSRIIYYDTKNSLPISIFFVLEIKKDRRNYYKVREKIKSKGE